METEPRDESGNCDGMGILQLVLVDHHFLFGADGPR